MGFKISKITPSINASATKIEKTQFDDALTAATEYQGKSFNGLNLLVGKAPIARVTERNIGRIILDDEGGKTLSQVADFGSANEGVVEPTFKSGTIYTVDITDKLRPRLQNEQWFMKAVMDGRRLYEVHLAGVKASDWKFASA